MGTVETVTILFSDLVGSTSLESQVGPARADELRREHFTILREAIAEADGEEVKNTGDGIMAVFPSAAGATDCAVAMQQGFEHRNRDAPEQLTVRIGVSMGDATHEGDDYFGLPVIEAARLCDKAPGAAILVPELVKMMVKHRGADAFRAAGALELKGIPEPVESYEVIWEPLGEEVAAPLPLPPRLIGVPPVAYVGREAEIEKLAGEWEAVTAGERRVVFVAGEPGIGKTRLVTHAALRRHAEGAAVLYGRCEEDLATPYGPWIEALDHYVENAPDEVLSAHVERHGGELGRLIPSLSRRVDDLPEPKQADPETERYLLFGAVVGLLGEASAERPVTLLLDDLHWADKPTLGLLKHVVAASATLPLLVLGTYRDSELTREHPLADALADLRREQGVERIALAGLEREDVVAIMEAAAGHEMDEVGMGLADEIAGETGGNPFFVTELLRHLTESGNLVRGSSGRWGLKADPSGLSLPQSVREVVGRRVERLGEPCSNALTAAAVIGRNFDVEVLVRIVEPGEDELLDLLEQAVAASVLVERADQPGSFSFAHALINHTLYESLGGTRRTRVHMRVAEALEEICGAQPGPRVAELAHHWANATAAVDLTKAIDYSRKAGERALGDLAPDEALRWFAQALELYDQQPAQDPGERCDLLTGLGEAQRQAGDPEFRRTLLEASGLALELDDRDRLATAVLANNRGIMSTAGLIDDGAVAMLEAAVERVDESDPARRAMLLALLALELTWSGDLSRRLRLADEALELARRSGDERTLAVVLWRRYNAVTVPETLDTRTEEMAELKQLTRRLNDPVLSFWAAIYGTNGPLERGDRGAFREALADAQAIADELHQPVPHWLVGWLTAVEKIIGGDLDTAERQAEAAAQHGSDAGQADALTFYVGQLAQIRWARGDPEEVEEVTEMVAAAAEDNPELSAAQALLALAYAESGRDEEVRALLEAHLASGFEDVARDMAWLTTISNWAYVAASIGHEDAAKVLSEQLEPWAEHFPSISITVWMPVAHYLGELDATLGRFDEAEAHFRRALELEERFEAPLFLAVTRLAWGRMLLARGTDGDEERGRELLAEAQAAAERHGFGMVERRAQALLELPTSSAPTPT